MSGPSHFAVQNHVCAPFTYEMNEIPRADYPDHERCSLPHLVSIRYSFVSVYMEREREIKEILIPHGKISLNIQQCWTMGASAPKKIVLCMKEPQDNQRRRNLAISSRRRPV